MGAGDHLHPQFLALFLQYAPGAAVGIKDEDSGVSGFVIADRLRYGFRLTTARDPNEREQAVLTAQLAAHLEHFQADPESAKKLLAIGAVPRDESLDLAEHASYTLIGNLLLNLDETMTKE